MVDSGADISPDLAREKGIYYLPLYVNIGGDFLKDRIDISPDEFYSYIKKEGVQAKTSLPAPGDIMELIEEIKNDHDKLIMITIGSNFSGTFNLYDMIEANGLRPTLIVETQLWQKGLGSFCQRSHRSRKSFQEVKKVWKKYVKLESIFTLESLKYIIEGGRVPKTYKAFRCLKC